MSNMSLTQPLDQDMQTLQIVLSIHSLRLSINWQRNLPALSLDDAVTTY